ncbi:GGDEF domain-containing protein [Acetobacterium wieringae]|uniref:GGDEF domain-containing protein n=1 Tax=Acetobacterium wieringae TaxID=52694 RepID=UPI0020347555|nr:GGDEF domain-containing protein [Acetobacterium wieringae]URN84268.1 GGDEF domain-containing protein [Acetobacterium wieringae]
MRQLITINHELHEKWRQVLFRTCIYIGVIIFVAEFFIFVFNKHDQPFSPVIIRYLVFYLALPTFLNLIFIVGAYFILKSEKTSEKAKNYTVALLFFLICACVQCFHYTFPAILCVPCIAVFITVIFLDINLTRLIFGLSYGSLILAFLIARFEADRAVEVIFLDCVVAGIMIFCAYLVATVLTRYTSEQAQSIHDSYLKQMELIQEAKTEPLTGLLNRRAMVDVLGQAVYQEETFRKPLIMAVIDLDDFKQVNDTYGHRKGDEVLIALAEILKRNTPGTEQVFRYGGEEFVLLFSGHPIGEVVAMIDNMHQEFGAHDFGFNEGGKITFSCGIAEYADSGWSTSEFFEKADQALYLAKNCGKNQNQIYEKRLEEHMLTQHHTSD